MSYSLILLERYSLFIFYSCRTEAVSTVNEEGKNRFCNIVNVLSPGVSLVDIVWSSGCRRKMPDSDDDFRSGCRNVSHQQQFFSELDNLVLSTCLIMWIGHRKEIRKLTFRALALRRSVSFRISLRWPIHIINTVDKTKLSCYTSHRRSPTVFF